MAELADAPVSNTGGATHTGSIPVPGTSGNVCYPFPLSLATSIGTKNGPRFADGAVFFGIWVKPFFSG